MEGCGVYDSLETLQTEGDNIIVPKVEHIIDTYNLNETYN